MNNIKEYQKHFVQILPKLLETDFKRVPPHLIFKKIDKKSLETFIKMPYYISDGIMLVNKSFCEYPLMRNMLITLWVSDRETLIQAYKETSEMYGNITWEDATKEINSDKQKQMVFNLLIPDVLWCKDIKK